jgi:hypothetical protein
MAPSWGIFLSGTGEEERITPRALTLGVVEVLFVFGLLSDANIAGSFDGCTIV